MRLFKQRLSSFLVLTICLFVGISNPCYGEGNNGDTLKITEFNPTVFFKKESDQLIQAFDLHLFSNIRSEDAYILVNHRGSETMHRLGQIAAGKTTKRIFLPDSREQRNLDVKLYAGNQLFDEINVEAEPQKHWEVSLIHGSHHDLGYTGIPDRILEEFRSFIYDILDYCDSTSNWPEESKFHFVFENAWSALYFLQNASKEDRERLINYLKSGQLELSALFANVITDIVGAEELNRLIYPSMEVGRKYNVPIVSAELNDIPGINWGLVSVLAGSGIKYLYAGIQDYFAWGGVVPIPWDEEQVMRRDVQSAFYWEGPTGDSVLFWYGGGSINNLDLWDAVQGEAAINEYLQKQQQGGYDYDMILLKVIGGMRDNSLPDFNKSLIVKTLNEKWEYPKIEFTINADFFEKFEKRYGSTLRKLRGDLTQTDYNIGAICTPHETGINRINHNLLPAAETFSTIAASISDFNYPGDQIANAYERMLLYDEHCWGMANPTGPAQQAAESQKCLHATQSSALTDDLLVKSLNKIADQIQLEKEGLYIVVYNSLSSDRTDIVEVKARPDTPVDKPFFKERRHMGDHIYFVNRAGEVPGRKQVSISSSFLDKPFQVRDVSSGKITEHQLRVIDDPMLPLPQASSRYALSEVSDRSQSGLVYEKNQATDLLFVANNLPSLGYKVFRLEPFPEDQTTRKAYYDSKKQVIENDFYRISFNIIKGIHRIYDKELKQELINPNEDFGFAEIFTKKVGTGVNEPSSISKIEVIENGPVFTSVLIERTSAVFPVINQLVTIYHGIKKIEVATRILKTPIPFLELYASFPFNIESPKFRLESVNSIFKPVEDQLPGTVTDYYSITNGMSVYNDRGTITWSSIEAPVVKLSEVWPGYVSQAHHGKTPLNYVHEFPQKFERSNIFSFLSSNNIRTNFTTVENSDLLFRHTFTSYKGPFDVTRSATTGMRNSNPLLPVIINENKEGNLKPEKSFFECDDPNIKLLTMKVSEDGSGLIVRLQETSGVETDARVSLPFLPFQSVERTDIAERRIGDQVGQDNEQVRLHFKPFEIITLKFKMQDEYKTSNEFFYSY